MTRSAVRKHRRAEPGPAQRGHESNEGRGWRRSLIVALTSVAFLAVACGGGSDSDSGELGSSGVDNRDDIGSSGEASEDGSKDSGEPSASGSENEENGGTASSSGSSSGSNNSSDGAALNDDGAGSCLIGDWEITERSMNNWYDSLDTQGLDFSVVGGTAVSFTDDGRFVYSPEFTMSLTASGVEGSGEARGSVSGNWEGVDGVVLTDITDDDLSMTVKVSGVVIDTAGTSMESTPLVDTPYDCSGDKPVLFFATGEGGGRVPMELEPRS